MTDTNYAPLKMRVIRGFEHFGLDVLIMSETHRAEPLIMVPIEQNMYTPSTFHLTNDNAQMLMDELWECGVRPTNGEGSVGQIGALKAHLEDMRKLAFHEIDTKDKNAII